MFDESAIAAVSSPSFEKLMFTVTLRECGSTK